MTAEEAKKRLLHSKTNDAEQREYDIAVLHTLDKQIPKKPKETRCALMCASCGHKITEKGCKKLNRNYCKKCGQKIYWGDIK